MSPRPPVVRRAKGAPWEEVDSPGALFFAFRLGHIVAVNVAIATGPFSAAAPSPYPLPVQEG